MPDAPEITIRPAREPAAWSAARTLIREYASTLDFSLAFQGFEHELKELRLEYGPPTGALFLARDGPRYAGCVGLRRFDAGVSEMKRLYVRPPYRRFGVGRRLAVAILDEARRLGYRSMLLDTVPSMTTAIALYRSLGFLEVAPYRFNPIPGAVYFRMELTGGGRAPPRGRPAMT